MLRSKYNGSTTGTTLPLDTSSSLFPVPLHGFESTSYGLFVFCPDPDPMPLYVQISAQFVLIQSDTGHTYFTLTVRVSVPTAPISSPFHVTVLVDTLYDTVDPAGAIALT